MSERITSYIAGFLDGDGCIMAQLVKRSDYVYGYQIRTSIVFYQKTNNEKILHWLKTQLSAGYIRQRNDGMSEYTIVGMKVVKKVLEKLLPYLRLKKQLAYTVIKIIDGWPSNGRPKINHYLKLCRQVDASALYNYSKKRTNNTATVEKHLTNHVKST
jgi:hypothetical protein